MYFLQPYANWFLVVNIISLIGTVFLLKYFYYKKYRFLFMPGPLPRLSRWAILYLYM